MAAPDLADVWNVGSTTDPYEGMYDESGKDSYEGMYADDSSDPNAGFYGADVSEEKGEIKGEGVPQKGRPQVAKRAKGKASGRLKKRENET